MSVAITFSDQTEHERRKNEHGYSFFRRSKTKSLPHCIELETPVLFTTDTRTWRSTTVESSKRSQWPSLEIGDRNVVSVGSAWQTHSLLLQICPAFQAQVVEHTEAEYTRL